MLYPLSLLSLLLLFLIHLTSGHDHPLKHTHSSASQQLLPKDTIPFSTRAHWMRRANNALADLESPCPFGAFGTVIVNHSDTSEGPLGKLVCLSVNQNSRTGNPILHGEIAAINNCSSMFTDMEGEYRFSKREALNAFRGLSLYTNGEPCPMCGSAIRWSGFAECIYGTSIKTLFDKGWSQISISSEEVFERSTKLPGVTRLVKDVLANETDPYFSWQFDTSSPCPKGCGRTSDGESCEPEVKQDTEHEL